jgi:hypothetical protein
LEIAMPDKTGLLRHWLIPEGGACAGLLPDGDAHAVSQWLDALEAQLAERGVPLTPLILLRLEDLVTAWLAARRIEAVLWDAGVFCDAPTRKGKDADEAAMAVSALVEHAGKARERTRKAMKDLEEACEKLGAPIDQGIADRVRPLLEKSRGVLEDALAFEQAKHAANGSADASQAA